MVWAIEYTDELGEWFWGRLTEDEQAAVISAVDGLEQGGPALGRLLVDTLEGSRHPNMKELRPPGSNLRVLFAFSPHAGRRSC